MGSHLAPSKSQASKSALKFAIILRRPAGILEAGGVKRSTRGLPERGWLRSSSREKFLCACYDCVRARRALPTYLINPSPSTVVRNTLHVSNPRDVLLDTPTVFSLRSGQGDRWTSKFSDEPSLPQLEFISICAALVGITSFR